MLPVHQDAILDHDTEAEPETSPGGCYVCETGEKHIVPTALYRLPHLHQQQPENRESLLHSAKKKDKITFRIYKKNHTHTHIPYVLLL